VRLEQRLYDVVVENRCVGTIRRTDDQWRFEPASWFAPISGCWDKLKDAREAISAAEHVRSFALEVFRTEGPRVSARSRDPHQVETHEEGKKPPGRYKVGQTIGNRTILERFWRDEKLGLRKRPRLWVRCRCVCGNEQEIRAKSLCLTPSCGCLRRPAVGAVFGIRTVIASKPRQVTVRCVCGAEQTLPSLDHLKDTYSCGCTKPPADALGPKLTRLRQRRLRSDPATYLMDIIRKRAAVRKGEVPFTIKKEDLVVPEVCPMRGTPFERGENGQKTDDSPTIVLTDPAKGYVPGNIQIISWRAFADMEQQALIERKKARAAKVAAQEVTAEREKGKNRRQVAASQVYVREARKTEELKQWSEELAHPVYATRFTTLNTGIRLSRVLRELGVVTVKDALKYRRTHLLERPNSGKATVKEMERLMEAMGITWPNPAVAKLMVEGQI